MGGSAYINNIEYKEFDNFYRTKIIIKNKEWTSSEQAYQALKFEDENYLEIIRKETDLAMIIHYGHSKYIKYIENWDNNLYKNLNNNPLKNNSRINLMYNVNLQKFKQNNDLKKLLISTDGKIKCTGSTSFWNKWNSIILEKIREELRNL